MSLLAAQTLYALQLGSTLIPGIKQQRLNVNPKILAEATDGSVYAGTVNMVGQENKIDFTTLDPVTLLNLINGSFGPAGAIGSAAGAIATSLSMYAQDLQNGGTRLTTGTKFTATLGILYASKLSCKHGAYAELASEFIPYSTNGTAAPLGSPQPGFTLPTLPTTEANRYGLGSIQIGGVALTGVTEVDIDFGPKVDSQSTDGDIFYSFGYIKEFMTKMTIKGKSASWLAQIGQVGKCVNATDSSVFFRQYDRCGSFKATAGFGFSMNGRADIKSGFAGNSGDPSEFEIEITGYGTPGNPPFAFSAVS